MKVRELMSSPAHTCRATDSLATAASLLWEHDCGMLPVVDAAGRVCRRRAGVPALVAPGQIAARPAGAGRTTPIRS